MIWFVVQRLSSDPDGGVITTYIGPFFGDPNKARALLGPSDFVLIYNNGSWVDLPKS